MVLSSIGAATRGCGSRTAAGSNSRGLQCHLSSMQHLQQRLIRTSFNCQQVKHLRNLTTTDQTDNIRVERMLASPTFSRISRPRRRHQQMLHRQMLPHRCAMHSSSRTNNIDLQPPVRTVLQQHHQQ